jgi:L-aminopeptidase/D-esterase-like protein
VAGVDVRGAAPGTRETDLLRGYNAVEKVHAVMLSGGSAFGLDAASGAMRYLEENDTGIDVGVAKVPIVPAAVIFDLAVGDASVRPGKREGYLACKAATADAQLTGRVGAGTGASVGMSLGIRGAMPGGIGTCCADIGGVRVAALAVVNAFGDVYDHHTGEILAGARMDDAIVPCMGAPERMIGQAPGRMPPFVGCVNTTLGVVATNAALTREEANKLASIAHDGYAMAIRPVHTSMDGDTVFALATGETAYTSFLPLLAAAAEVMALAIQDAVR